MSEFDYVQEQLAQVALDLSLALSQESLEALTIASIDACRQYKEYSYEPSWGDRLNDIEEEYKKKLKTKEAELNNYIKNAESAVARILHKDGYQISIGEGGSVRIY